MTDEGETTLRPGMVAGLPRRAPATAITSSIAHNAVVRLLEIGTRTTEEVAHYSDIDMMVPRGCQRLRATSPRTGGP